jgi:cytochrome d ubiquinol oxidase subunit II
MTYFLTPYSLPIIFAGLMGLSILIYVVLDGYDLGVGILMSRMTLSERHQALSSIAPFWDANETWLVLGIGILLVAFPKAHGLILTQLYLPTTIMLIGLILRGVSFDFRAKARDHHQILWDRVFISGSLITTFTQGYMLGQYIVGFKHNLSSIGFSLLIGICLIAGYNLMGASWLILKSKHQLQKKSIRWAQWALWGTALGLICVSCATPLVSTRIFNKWFRLPYFFILLPVPILTSILVLKLNQLLNQFLNIKFSSKDPTKTKIQSDWKPLVGSIGLFILGFIGLAYSFYPYVILDQMTIWDAASAPESLMVILMGVVIVLPFIIGYTVYAYWVFRGKI